MPPSNHRSARLVAAVLLPAVLIAAPIHPATAAAADPSALVTAMGEQIRQVLADHSLSPLESQRRFHSVVDEGFDIPAISRFVLGRFWQGSTASFRQEFDGVFEDYVLQSLSARFADPSGESMTVTATRPRATTAPSFRRRSFMPTARRRRTSIGTSITPPTASKSSMSASPVSAWRSPIASNLPR